MTKRPADTQSISELPLSDPNHPWTARGYRAELANIPKSPTEDPCGEIAYQRAFLEVARLQPLRVPDPSRYPHSHSAQEYLRRRDEAIFTVRVRPDKDEQPPRPPTPPITSSPNEKLPSPRYSHDPVFPPRKANADARMDAVPTIPPPNKNQLRSPRPLLPADPHSRPPSAPGPPPGVPFGRPTGAPPGYVRPEPPTPPARTPTPPPPPLVLEPRIKAPNGPGRILY
ncbi:uncharacterized protein Z518_02532 [Rhinocladiella mackenziei CBS 650.93]|uniref:Uncharacterized protein n=1 Tax=Rhinocladiella mackenziei CBS 650.93 TaxID=1442369 RepID=A0A0D2HBR0_9EURO|nr:uncharacterized protein Z518_02532 [Rhinocladiella mackenziei CBS 650.93]KIX07878.1 hypothetical protein Z518_02532 [Rhinocladiella mackenziei CBS 650.93]